jgi:hypothetical protein
MNQAVELLTANRIMKDDIAEFFPINRQVGFQDFRTESLDDRVVYGLTRLKQLVPDGVRFCDMTAELGEHAPDCAFARTDSAG